MGPFQEQRKMFCQRSQERSGEHFLTFYALCHTVVHELHSEEQHNGILFKVIIIIIVKGIFLEHLSM